MLAGWMRIKSGAFSESPLAGSLTEQNILHSHSAKYTIVNKFQNDKKNSSRIRSAMLESSTVGLGRSGILQQFWSDSPSVEDGPRSDVGLRSIFPTAWYQHNPILSTQLTLFSFSKVTYSNW